MTIFNVSGDKEKINTLIERVKQASGALNVIDDQFAADHLEKDINIIAIDGEAADYIVEFCEENNLKCELV